MCAAKFLEPRAAGSRVEAVLTGLGGGQWRELDERHERTTHAIAGVIVLLGAALAWLVATLAVSESVRWPIPAVLALTLVFGLLVGTVTRGTASGLTRGLFGVLARGAVAVAVGVVVGELAVLALFSDSIDRRLDEQAARTADSGPAVAQAATDLERARDTRAALDHAVEQARAHRDEALVVARCEYHPTPACPQTRITGVPGVGPETHTDNQLLADAQRELDNAVAARDRRAPELDAKIAHGEQALAQAREAVIAAADHGLGARWVAMNRLTVASAGALMLRLLTIGFFALLYLLPLILRLWRGDTTHDRRAAARAQRDSAEVEADTAIAVKRAEVRAAAETMWAEQQLNDARLAVAAQNEIDRARHRRRVAEALGGAVQASSQRETETVEDDVYLPIAAEAEAGSRAAAQLPAGAHSADVEEPENLPAEVESGSAMSHERGTLVPAIPDVTRAAARWIRPLVPPFVARAIDTTTQPLRAAREVFEEIEEITFSFKRTHKVTVNSEGPRRSPDPGPADSGGDSSRVESSVVRSEDHRRDATAESSSWDDRLPNHPQDPSPEPTGRERQPELTEAGGPGELRGLEGPRQLPSGE